MQMNHWPRSHLLDFLGWCWKRGSSVQTENKERSIYCLLLSFWYKWHLVCLCSFLSWCSGVHICRHIHVHTCIHTHMNANAYTYKHTWTHKHACTCTHMHTHTNTHSFTHTHTYTHTHTHTIIIIHVVLSLQSRTKVTMEMDCSRSRNCLISSDSFVSTITVPGHAKKVGTVYTHLT